MRQRSGTHRCGACASRFGAALDAAQAAAASGRSFSDAMRTRLGLGMAIVNDLRDPPEWKPRRPAGMSDVRYAQL